VAYVLELFFAVLLNTAVCIILTTENWPE